jgi:hypothetical protein
MVVLIAALVVAGQEARLLSRQKDEQQALALRRDRLHGQLQRLRTESVAAEDDFAQAGQELAQLQAEHQSVISGRELEIRSWAKKSRYLQELFAKRPGQAIPELQLLTPSDWLRLSHEAQTETELQIRQSLSAIRSESTMKFAQQLSSALKKYTDAHDGILPSAPADLTPYFDPVVDPEILARYEMQASGKVSDLRAGRYVITQAAPIDADYDYRNYVGVPPYGMSARPWRMDELSRMQTDAREAYSKATGIEEPASTSDWISYVASPPIREILLGLEEYRKSHPSKSWPERASQLLPLLTSPEAKGKAAKIWPEELAP